MQQRISYRLLLLMLALSTTMVTSMTASSNPATLSIGNLVDAEGRLNSPEGFMGTIDSRGFSVYLDECEGPVALPENHIAKWGALPCDISITCKDPFNFPITPNGGTSVISGHDMVVDYLTEDCNSNLTYTINGQQLLDFYCEDIGPQTLTIVATNESGNTASCSIDIQVVDLIAPSITCPPDQTAVLDANCEFEIPDYRDLASVVDNCSGTISQLPDVGTFVNSDETVILTVVDQGGQMKTCTFDLTVEDNIPPIAGCQNITAQLDGNGDRNITAADIESGFASDNCGTVNSVSLTPSNFDCGDVGANTVTLTVNDGNGNTATCTSTVFIVDYTAPTASCVNTTVQLDINGQGSQTAAAVESGSSDNCGAVVAQSLSPNTFDCSDLGANTVTLTVIDGNGNTGTCTATVTVEDNIRPIINCPPSMMKANDPGECGAFVSFSPQIVDDNCSGVTWSGMPASGSFFSLGATIVVLTAEDTEGNTRQCAFTVWVNYVPECVNTTVQLDANGAASQTAAAVESGSSDNCGTINTVSLAPDNFSCGDVGANTVTLTVNDGNGNTATCTATVTVEDNIAPTAGCVNTTVQLDMDGAASQTAAAVESGSSDNCGTINTVSLAPDNFGCGDVGANTVTLTVNDGNGNTGTCTAIVTVEDNIAPTAGCVNTTVQLDMDGAASQTAAAVESGSSDNCGTINTVSLAPDNFSCGDVGANTVTLTVNDGNGNTATCTANVTVEDTSPPVPVCLSPTITFNGETAIPLTIDDLYDSAVSSDNCDAVFVTAPVGDVMIGCEEVGNVVPITVSVEDASGNPASCTANITVIGLPCGWVDNDGVGCTSNTSAYDQNTATISLTATNCAWMGWPYSADQSAFVFSELCGDGEIIAQVTDVTGTGFAGVMMRDSEAPDAPMVAMGTNRLNKVLRQMRVLPGYPAFPQFIVSYNQFWVRISRSGNQFSGFASVDGISWIPYLNQQIMMSNTCIRVGLFTYSEKPGNPITATFDNVYVTGPAIPLAGLPSTIIRGEAVSVAPTLDLFPNPSSGNVHIALDHFEGQDVEIRLYDKLGKLMYTQQLEEVFSIQQRLDLPALDAGTYLVSISTATFQETKRLIIARP